MATLLLIRHGQTRANAEGILAGWTPGVGLDDTGLAQAEALAGRLRDLPIAGIFTSPLERCLETTKIATGWSGVDPVIDDRLAEVRYGDWQGRALKDLAKEELWPAVQQHPSGVTFPGGESMAAMAARATEVARARDAEVEAAHGNSAIWLAVSHGDVIKAIAADALGLHLDQFQRIVVDPCSVTVIRYTPLRTFVVRLNDVGSDLHRLVQTAGDDNGDSPESGADGAVGGGVSGGRF